ncbi:c-type cytochrome domain-containing protein [Roseimaritima multifibrata]|nr:c-type cytochrome domain-containing protein [Roseimaritima multifibrata]
MNLRPALLLLLLLCGLPISSVSAKQAVAFSTEIVPLLEKHCVACHSVDEPEGGLVLASYAGLMGGGDSGPAITPGTAQSSRILLMIKGTLAPKMPPEEDGFNEEELAILTEWIEQGAIGPKDGVKESASPAMQFPKIVTDAEAIQPATAVSVAPSGKLLAVARFGSVTLQTDSGEILNRWEDFPGKINSLRFSKDGKTLVVASGLTGKYGLAVLIELGDLSKQEEALAASKAEPSDDSATDHSSHSSKRLFQGHRDTLYAAELSPDGQRLATAGYDQQILLWDVATGELVNRLEGHNGAILGLAFSPDGKVLVSGSADETVKVWNVETGERFDTLNQPEGEVLAVTFTEDGKYILACSADHRFRAWKLTSIDKPRTNPLITTRYIDDASLNGIAIIPGGKGVIVVSESGNAKIVRIADWNVAATLQPFGATTSDVAVAMDGKEAFLTLFDGTLVRREIPSLAQPDPPTSEAPKHDSIFLDLAAPTVVAENPKPSALATPPLLPRNVIVHGNIDTPKQVDRFRWAAKAGEVWAVDCDAVADSKDTTTAGGLLDPTIQIENSEGKIVTRVRLQAVRESYFTFRGKSSTQSNDFRMFGWDGMHLDDYLYSNGEVTRLWMHPRGPDSGFDVYPGEGDRWTYFETSHVTHALGEPAYIVKPLATDEAPLANGLPVFEIGYQNDDDPMRREGKNSRLIFRAPSDGLFTVAISDRRLEGGADYRYELRIRPARPSFSASVTEIKQPLLRGAGREFTVRVERYDGFDGAVVFDCDDLPAGVHSTFPVTVEPGQKSANGILWLDEADIKLPPELKPTVFATGWGTGVQLERVAGSLGSLTSADSARIIPKISLNQTVSASGQASEFSELTIAPGETVSAIVEVERAKDFDAEVSFGKEKAGRNATHGVYVDNIGLNGLLLLKGMEQRKFFITADPISKPGMRLFYLKAELDGGITSLPIKLHVQPR